MGTIALVACSGPSVLIAGESVRSPEPPAPVLEIAVLAGDDLTPLPALIRAGGVELTADDLGKVETDWLEEPLEITASAPGFHAATALVETLPDDGFAELRLDPVVLVGTVMTNDGRPLPATTVQLGRTRTTTDAAGEFRVARALPGDIMLSRPAWQPVTEGWAGEAETVELTMEPLMIKALRVGGDKAGNAQAWADLLELADNSEVNAFVVDTKDEPGRVLHDTEVALAHEIGAVEVFYDLDAVIADMDAHGLYKITRIVTFQDDFLGRARPDIAAKNSATGDVWANNKDMVWLDPTDPDSWEYPLDLAEEACRRGFDEIQFDYVRFPSDGPVAQLKFDDFTWDGYYDEDAQQTRVETVAAFLTEAHTRLNPMGCAVAADIFAITLESVTDEGVGQLPGPLSSSVDVLSPMIYTYTYGSGWKGFADPDEHAEELVTAALDAGLPKIEGYSIVRPWLQRAFIEPEEVLAIQGIAEDRDLGWMLWSANTAFDERFVRPATGG